ncbi:FecR protein [Chitinophaga dinghuensis]|uniref:FecR protein n=1 Tax=Chitinophaga dinghuensis TaxID=1539050 RepID=A0A327VMB4_9BACT|nr:FecR family protein [Chitinophaga dinghuensis]RAJ75005.1 FecR protein [Chitinophaga dinghuensis]
MTKEDVKNLIPTLISGQCRAEEEAAFQTWLQQAPEEELSEIMELYYDTMGNGDVMSSMPADFTSTLQQRIRSSIAPPQNNWPYVRVAAAIALLLSIGVAGYLLKPKSPAKLHTNAIITPGTDKAILTLADGTQVELGRQQDDSSIHIGSQVIRLDDSKISYNGDATAKNTFNTLTTPRGAQFQIILPDGSHVWLNAVSSLRYPVAFNEDNRTVELTGQAYFDIVPSTTPFIVKTGVTTIQVLGTGFDVMSYQEEGPAKTTLLKGSIVVETAGSRCQLKPGDQATYNENTAKLDISRPPVDEVIAWKEGEFRFNGISIVAIMRQLSRWYDVDIKYEGPPPTTAFSGNLPRKENVNEILHALEATEAAHFSIEGRTIIVRK